MMGLPFIQCAPSLNKQTCFFLVKQLFFSKLNVSNTTLTYRIKLNPNRMPDIKPRLECTSNNFLSFASKLPSSKEGRD